SVRPLAQLPAIPRNPGGPAQTTGVRSSLLRTALREALSLFGSGATGIHLFNPARPTGSAGATPFFDASRSGWRRPRRTLEPQKESIRCPCANGRCLNAKWAFERTKRKDHKL